jgi:hypothetical protein
MANKLHLDVITLSHYIGPYLSKYAQKNQKKVDVHTYPSGTTVIKAFTANDFIFYDAKKIIIEISMLDSFESVTAVKITWRIQKRH